MELDKNTFRQAVDDFRKERSKAAIQSFWANITGKSLNLLPFDEISTKLHATVKAERGLQNIPLDAIVGSVGRYHDFNRNFLPLRDNDMDRWAHVKTAMTSTASKGVPPISVYKLGDSYFVLDGNHRVSIAKQMGFKEIEAYVTQIKTRVPFTADMSAEDLILQEEYANFLERTHIDKILTGVDLTLSFPGQYKLLSEHINVHQYYMGIERNNEVSYEEAVRHWYDTIYQPVTITIEDLSLLHDFPERTITDLYLWVLDHQSQLQDELGWQIRTEVAADDLAISQGKQAHLLAKRGELHMTEVLGTDYSRVIKPIRDTVEELARETLFKDILVSLDGSEGGWHALEQAIIMSRLVGGEIRGLHVIRKEISKQEDSEFIQSRFSATLEAEKSSGNLLITEGEISDVLIDHSRLNDLLVLKLTYPPSTNLFDRLSSGFTNILRHINRPVLTVTDYVTPMDNLLLAFDGSPKSKEALYISAYIAARWHFPLHVITIDDGTPDLALEVAQANAYLTKLDIDYDYIIGAGDVADLVNNAVSKYEVNLLLLGGYSYSSIFEAVLGSIVNPILRNIKIPILICQ
ncbi:MAG: universal stress protein [Anaerolineaceae bacterium]|nr:universal stress protein [Anaerolineaceae bacterium]